MKSGRDQLQCKLGKEKKKKNDLFIYLFILLRTLLLPSGMDGAASEHSSARVERFLQMSSEPGLSANPSGPAPVPNWRVINPTTPANFFHALRRQLVEDVRIPLVVVGPKGILRHPACVSSLNEVSENTRFVPVIPDDEASFAARKVLWCSGKTFYDLVAAREKKGLSSKDVAIVRIEELVPFPHREVAQVVAKYTNATSFVWCNEEHENQGCWNFVYPRFYTATGQQLGYAGREVSGVPAVGIADLHKAEVEAYYDMVFD